MGTPSVEWLTVAGDAQTWRSIGLTVTADGRVPLHGTGLRIVAPDGGRTGVIGWAFSGIEPIEAISGLSTEIAEPTTPAYASHPLGVIDLDHVVIVTDDLARTSEAIAAATGCELKRIRESGAIRQGFHRIGRGGLIVELVERTDPDDPPDPGREPTNEFWGLVLNVEDLDRAHELLGDDRMSAPKDAVQPGRRISTIATDVGLGTHVALMTRELR